MPLQAESTDDGAVIDIVRSITSLEWWLNWLSHEIDAAAELEASGGAGGFSNVLSLELVNDARLANSLLKLFDERLSVESVGGDGDAVLADSWLYVAFSWKDWYQKFKQVFGVNYFEIDF